MSPSRRSRSIEPRRAIALVIVVLAIAWLVAFVASNSQTVRVSFVFAHVRLSLIWVMLICAALGAIIALGLSAWRRRRTTSA